MPKQFFIDWLSTKGLHKRLDIAFKKGLSSGHYVGIQGKTLKCFPMGDQYHPDGFDCFEADMIIPTKRFGTFLHETWFAYKEAKQRGLVVLLDCETRSIMPLAPEFSGPDSLLEWVPNPVYENRLV